jgi:hypothetical protein
MGEGPHKRREWGLGVIKAILPHNMVEILWKDVKWSTDDDGVLTSTVHDVPPEQQRGRINGDVLQIIFTHDGPLPRLADEWFSFRLSHSLAYSFSPRPCFAPPVISESKEKDATRTPYCCLLQA